MTTTETTTIENYCIDCKAVAQADCDSRGHIAGTLGEQSPTEQPVGVVGECDDGCHFGDHDAVADQNEQSRLFPRYSFAVVTGRYKILDNRSDSPTRITQIATADGEDEARTIVGALNAIEQHAALVAERERLVEVSRAAMHALRSYQYGNSSLDLAEEIADFIERTLTTSEQEGGRRG